jgi:uncharacterized membrane protein
MDNDSANQPDAEQLASLKKVAVVVYLCQVLAFAFAGLPLLVGVAINFMKQDQAKGTWLESHFNWQIKTVWVVLAGFALSGLTLEFGIGFFTLLATIVWMVYRIVIGWTALNADQPLKDGYW